MTYLFLIVSVLVCLSPVPIFAACPAPSGNVYTSVDCSQTEVQSCITAAQSHGSDAIVQVASGQCTWTAKTSVSTASNSIHLRGASQNSSDAITLNYTGDGDLTASLSATNTFNMSNFYFNADGSDAEYIIYLTGVGDNAFRIHDTTIVGCDSTSISRIFGDAYGVFDNMTITGPTREFCNIVGSSNATWMEAGGRGSSQAVFLENSTITWSYHNEGAPLFDAQNGGRYVIRYNNLTNCSFGNHGPDSGASGGMVSEVYANSITLNDYGEGCTWNISGGGFRAGTVIFHDNQWYLGTQCQFGVWGAAANIKLDYYRESGGYYPFWNYPCAADNELKFCSTLNSDWSGTQEDCKTDGDCTSGTCKWKLCSGSSNQGTLILCDEDGDCTGNGTCSFFIDGGTNASGRPCYQQAGIGQNNQSYPCYEWNNYYTGSIDECASPPCDVDFVGDSVNVVNEDYFNDTSYGTDYTCPHPLTGITGNCNPSIVGRSGYAVGQAGMTFRSPQAGDGSMQRATGGTGSITY